MADVPLRDYTDRRLDDLDRRITELFRLNDKRLDTMNEIREALKDQASRMATRTELERVDMTVRELQQHRANLDGRLLVISGGISGAVSVVLWLLTRLWI